MSFFISLLSFILSFVVLTVVHSGEQFNSSRVQDFSFLAPYGIQRDPFYVSPIKQGQQSRYDVSSPKVVGVIDVDGVKGALIRFDDCAEVVRVGDVVRGHVVVEIHEEEVVVKDSSLKEKRWSM